jgi:hypothetical protein
MPIELAFLCAVGLIGVIGVLIYAWRTRPPSSLGGRK